jgi:hypothetical protein
LDFAMIKGPNEITSLDAATSLLFHVGRHWRGASEFQRSLLNVIPP